MRASSANSSAAATAVNIFDFGPTYASSGYVYNKGTFDCYFRLNRSGDWADLLASSAVEIREQFYCLEVKRKGADDFGSVGAIAFGV